METVTDFIFLGSKITADGDCSHEIKRRLLLGRKAKTSIDSILKSRDITLPTKICLVSSVQFSHSVVSNSVRPQRWQPTRLPRPQDSPGKNTGVGCHFLLQCLKVKSESEDAQSCPTLSDPMDCSPSGSSSMGFSRQEYWSGVPLPSPNNDC